MALLADGLLLLAALTAAAYCVVLSRRLSRLSGLDEGLGKAIVDLSERVDVMNAALADARGANESAARELRAALRDADDAATRLKALAAETQRAEAMADSGEFSDEPAVGAEDAPQPAPTYDETIRTGADPLLETMNVIDRTPPGEDDEVFANRLVDALSSLQPKPGTAT